MMVKTKGAAVAYNTRRLQFDLSELYPELLGDMLTLTIPALEFSGPLLTEAAVFTLFAAGLTQSDIDTTVDEMLITWEIKSLVRILMERRR